MRKPKAQIFFYSRQGVPMFYRLDPVVVDFDLNDYTKKSNGTWANVLELLLDDGFVLDVDSPKRGHL